MNRVYNRDLFAMQSAGSINSPLLVQTPNGVFPSVLYCGSSGGSPNCTYSEKDTKTHSYIFDAPTGGTYNITWCGNNITAGIAPWLPPTRKDKGARRDASTQFGANTILLNFFVFTVVFALLNKFFAY